MPTQQPLTSTARRTQEQDLHTCLEWSSLQIQRHSRHQPSPAGHQGRKHILGLLYVCRQIHFEIALLPYTMNMFSFTEFDVSLEPFLQQRSPPQIRSIHYLELVTYQAVQMWASSEHFSPYMSREFRTLSCLPNLRELHFVSHMSSSLYIDWGSHLCLLDLEEKPLANLRSALSKHMPEVLLRVFLI